LKVDRRFHIFYLYVLIYTVEVPRHLAYDLVELSDVAE
jgi:hypothetical protein